jgi:hypothetical protein
MSPRITKELYSNKTTKKRLTDYLKRINSKLRKYQCPEWNQKRTLATRDPPLHPLLPQISSYSCPIHTTEKIANTGPLLSTRPLCFPLKSLYLSLNKATWIGIVPDHLDFPKQSSPQGYSNWTREQHVDSTFKIPFTYHITHQWPRDAQYSSFRELIPIP